MMAGSRAPGARGGAGSVPSGVPRRGVPDPADILPQVNGAVTPPLGQPLQIVHPVLPFRARLWGAGRPSYPDEPPRADAVEAGVRAWRESGVGFVLSLIEDWEVPRRAPGLFEALARERIGLRRYPIPDFGVPRETPEFGQLLRDIGEQLAAGDGVLVHCNAGLGRTAVVLASILKAHGLAVDPVTELRRIYRSSAMEEPVQEAFVRSLLTG
jgi:protein-tyrosine phosphatase